MQTVTKHAYMWQFKTESLSIDTQSLKQLNGSVKEPNKFHNYETETIIRKASDVAEYIELFGSSTRDCHAPCI